MIARLKDLVNWLISPSYKIVIMNATYDDCKIIE
jgi:hypothetical protein